MLDHSGVFGNFLKEMREQGDMQDPHQGSPVEIKTSSSYLALSEMNIAPM